MGDCGCVYVEVDETNDLSRSWIRKARKQYKCYGCGCVIERGTKYEETVSLYDGRWSRHRTCLDCQSVSEHLYCSGYYYGAMWQGVEEHIDYCGAEIDFNAIAKLTPMARENACAMIEEYWKGIEEDDE